MWWFGLDRAGLGVGQVAGTSECGDCPSGHIKLGGFCNSVQRVGF